MKLVINDTITFDDVKIINESFYPTKELTVIFFFFFDYNESFKSLDTDVKLNKIIIILDDDYDGDITLNEVTQLVNDFNKVERILKKITISKSNTEGIQIVFSKEY